MPSDLTIFAANYLVFIETLLAAVVLAGLLYQGTPDFFVRWAVASFITVVLAYALAQIAADVYNDPRPFATGHFHPLVAHAADSGFPSDHALLAATVVALVAFADLRLSFLFVPFAVLVDWARVGAGLHHVVDVLGSSLIVAVAALIGYALAPYAARKIMPYLMPYFRKLANLRTIRTPPKQP